MTHSEPVDDLVERPHGSSCLILGAIAVAAGFVVIILAAMAGSVLFSGGLTGKRPDPAAHPLVGQTLPHLELEPLTGADQPVTLDDLTGKVTVINFWATWCQPCWMEFPHIAELDRKYRHRPDFMLLSVSCGDSIPERVDTLRRATAGFLQRVNLHMPTYADRDWATRQALASRGGSTALPTTYLIDRQAVIRGVWVGFHPRDPEQIEQSVRRLLEEQG